MNRRLELTIKANEKSDCHLFLIQPIEYIKANILHLNHQELSSPHPFEPLEN